MKEELVDDLDRAGRRAGIRVVRVGLAEQRDHVEVALPPLVQEDSSDARDDALLEDRDVVFADHVHRLVRRTDPVDLDLALGLVFAGVDDQPFRAHEEVAPGILGPVQDGGGNRLDEVRRRLEFRDEHDDLVSVVHLRARVDPDGVHRLPVADERDRREVDGVHDADLDEVQGVDQVVRDDRADQTHAREAVDDRGSAEIHPLELVNLDSFHRRPRSISRWLLKDARAESAT